MLYFRQGIHKHSLHPFMQITKSSKHSLRSIQIGPCRIHVMFESGRVVQAFKSIVPRGTFYVLCWPDDLSF
ncbi:MAG: hypothetical protein LBI95_01150 [Holosporales bacterium]|nr:hypothetical protein [Holosporales bacterium]